MTLTTMPAQFIAGDSLELALSAAASEWPAADGYAVGLTLTPIAGSTPIAVAATDGASSWNVLLPSVTSAAMAAGAWRWLLAATKAGNRTTIAFGEVQVLPNPASTGDQRSAARRALDAIDAVLAGRASSSHLKFVFEDGRSIEHLPHSELIRLRQFYAARVAKENSRRSGPARVQVRL